MKQIIIVRTDLHMGTGKIAAQVAHASMKALLENFEHPNIKEWLAGPFAKIVVKADSEEELFSIMHNATEAGLITTMITDAGRTEFNGVPTNTCIAVGPASDEDLNPVTGHLKLL